jgi:cadmium resistance protein CadD (predicted permease)
MASWPATAATGLGIFAGTNIDDVVVLVVLFTTAANTGRPRRWEIVTGQVLGFIGIVATSVLIAFVLGTVPEQWIRLVGVVPLGIGLWGLWQWRQRSEDEESPPLAGSVWAVAALTIANGADDLSVYPPVFRTLGVGPAVITGVVFFVGVAIWCGASALLSAHTGVTRALGHVQDWLGPLVFVALGVVILLGVL